MAKESPAAAEQVDLAADDGSDDVAADLRKAFAVEPEPDDSEEKAESAEAEAEEAPEGQATPPDEAAPAKADEEPEAGEEAPLTPPAEWSADDHELFHKQPRDVQQWLLDKAEAQRTERERLTDEITPDRQRLDALDRVLKPRQEALKVQGLDEPRAIEQLFALSDFAAQRPVDFIRWFAQNRNLDLAQLAGPAQPNGQDMDELDDPRVNALTRQITELKGQLQGLTTGLQTKEQQEEERLRSQQQAELDAFKTAKAPDGSPLRPHFDEVKAYMAAYLKEGLVPDLPTAYDRAVRAHPDVSRKIAAAEKTKADAEAQKQRREHARAAQRAGASVSGTPAGSSPRQPKDDPADELRAVLGELGA